MILRNGLSRDKFEIYKKINDINRAYLVFK